jgi:uncharacterized membrane protein
MYQEREYQAQQQPYREWDERQQRRFPNSPLAQYNSQDRQQYRQLYPQSGWSQNRQTLNVGQGERQLSVAGGAALLLYTLINRSRSSWVTGPLGAYLIWRGQTGYCPVYQAMKINTAQPQSAWQGNGYGQQQRGWQGNGGVQQIPIQQGIQQQSNQQQSNRIEIRRAVTVNKPAQELYNFWRKLENLPQFMHHLERVEQTGDKRSHWKAKIAGGIPVEWDAEIVEDVPGKRIAWRTKPDSQVQQSGVVEFKEATGGRGATVTVDIHYLPPAGIIGETFGRLLNGITAQQVKDDIGRFKSLMEAGEIPTIEGQPAGR